jgi:hypothetical protein
LVVFPVNPKAPVPVPSQPISMANRKLRVDSKEKITRSQKETKMSPSEAL